MGTNKITLWDKIISILTYYTFGAVGIIWIIFCYLTRRKLTDFLTYHIYQSIFISIFLWLLNLVCEISFGLMLGLPLIGNIVQNIIVFTTKTPIYMGYSLVNFIIFAVLSYLSLFALFGKLSYFPFISDMVKLNSRR